MAYALLPRRAVYAIICSDGRHYVGSSSGLQGRWLNHQSALRRGDHNNIHLQAAWDELGESAFMLFVLEEVPDDVDLVSREQVWMDRLDTKSRGFNICPLAGTNKGAKLYGDCRAGLAATQRGRTHLSARLTERDVRDIRARHAAGMAKKALAREYGVRPSTIGRALDRVNWKHV